MEVHYKELLINCHNHACEYAGCLKPAVVVVKRGEYGHSKKLCAAHYSRTRVPANEPDIASIREFGKLIYEDGFRIG